MLIENISNEIQCVTWIPSFWKKEIREVDNSIWVLLLKNPNFKEFVEEDEISSKKTFKKSK